MFKHMEDAVGYIKGMAKYVNFHIFNKISLSINFYNI